jgi:steroid delta-isomerase-like uncharacterized protein
MSLGIRFSFALAVCCLCLCGNTTQNAPSLKSDDPLAGNKAVVRRQHEDVWSKGDLAAIDQLYKEDFVCHFVVGPEEWKGRDGVKKVVTQHRAAFPDWTEKIEDIVVEGDKVVTRFTSTGTHKGAFAGIAPTGKKVTISEVAIFRVKDGQIAEQWGFPDALGLLRQIGVDPLAKPKQQ